MKKEQKNKFIGELEEVVDKYVKSPPSVSIELVQIVRDCIAHFGCPEKAILACLMSLANTLRRSAEFCKKNQKEEEFLEFTGDPVVKLTLLFAMQIMSCKRVNYNKEENGK